MGRRVLLKIRISILARPGEEGGGIIRGPMVLGDKRLDHLDVVVQLCNVIYVVCGFFDVCHHLEGKESVSHIIILL